MWRMPVLLAPKLIKGIAEGMTHGVGHQGPAAVFFVHVGSDPFHTRLAAEVANFESKTVRFVSFLATDEGSERVRTTGARATVELELLELAKRVHTFTAFVCGRFVVLGVELPLLHERLLEFVPFVFQCFSRIFLLLLLSVPS